MPVFRRRPGSKRSSRPGARRRRLAESLEPRCLLASLGGEVFLDSNDDGQRSPTENGIADVRVYSDVNNNRVFDAGEPTTSTDESGAYQLDNLPAGVANIRVVTPEDHTQTSPTAYYGVGYLSSAASFNNLQTQLFEMTRDGNVLAIGSPQNERIGGLVLTNGNRFLSVNTQGNGVFELDRSTGQPTLLASSDVVLIPSLAHDSATDAVYAVSIDSATNRHRLHTVDRNNGRVGPAIGTGLTGLIEPVGLAFDTVQRRIIGFDNSTDTFFQFDTDGSARILAVASRPINSRALSFDGSAFLMSEIGTGENLSYVQVNPDTGVVSSGLSVSQPAAAEGLYHAQRGDAPVRTNLEVADALSGFQFGFSPNPPPTPPIVFKSVINEILVEPAVDNGGSVNDDRDQFVEFRGEPGGSLNPNTYFVIVSERDATQGEVQGIFDLSNQDFGDNGFLVLLPQGSTFSANPFSRVLQSTSEGFGGLPGDLYSDSHDTSDNIGGAILGSQGYFLIESETAPQIGDDIDLDDNGRADPDGVKSSWNVLDSISLHPDIYSGDQAYGQILLAQSQFGTDPRTRTTEPGTQVVVSDGFGYAARIGDSVASGSDDWLQGTPVPGDANDGTPLFFEIRADVIGRPTPLVFFGRDLDNVGESNFVGGVRGRMEIAAARGELDMEGNPQPPVPAVGITVLADTNGNGEVDLLTFNLDPDDVVDTLAPDPDAQGISNAFPNVTLSRTFTENEPVTDEIRSVAEDTTLTMEENRIFSNGAIEYFWNGTKLRADFYRPVSEVSIEAIGPNRGTSTSFGRLDAYTQNGQFLGSSLSGPLRGSFRERVTFASETENIGYALFYADSDQTRGSLFGRFDNLQYKQLEATAITDVNGEYEIPYLVPDQYEVGLLRNEQSAGLIGGTTQNITVSRYDNFIVNDVFRPNALPAVQPDYDFVINENAPLGTVIGTIEAMDLDGQDLTYEILQDPENPTDTRGVQINPNSGVLFVGPNADIDFESGNEIRLTVGANDSAAVATTLVTIMINDLNEPPVAADSLFEVAEGTPAGTVIGQINATDADLGQNESLMFEIIGGTGTEFFSLDANNGSVTINEGAELDFEVQSQLNLVVRVSDNAVPSLSTDTVVNIQVIDRNDSPVVTTTSLEVNENAVGKVGDVFVSDPDFNQTHAFELIGGTGVDLFRVLRNGSIEVRPDAVVDFEQGAAYTLTVRTIDSGSPPLAAQATIDVSVVDVDEPPTLDQASFSIAENATAGDLVGTLGTSDPDAGAGTYSITMLAGKDAGDFDFDPSSGELRISAAAELDFEGDSVRTVDFQVTSNDDSTQIFTTTVQVALTDSNDPPIVLTKQLVLSELAAAGTAVGRVEIQILEPDQGDEVTVAIIGGNAADLFTLDSVSRILRVAAGAKFDADVDSPPLVLTVEVTDEAGLSSTGDIDMLVSDVNEAPVFVTPPPTLTTIAIGQDFELTFPEDSIVDPEGRQFSLTVFANNQELPSWLAFNQVTRTLSGVPTPDQLGRLDLTVRAFEPGPLELKTDRSFSVLVERGASPLTNQRDPFDVDANGTVAASDALRIINYINSFGNGVSALNDNPFFGFVDVNQDLVVTPLDSLLVINALNNSFGSFSVQSEQFISDEDDREDLNDQALSEYLTESSLF